jgi:hypothetical protein
MEESGPDLTEGIIPTLTTVFGHKKDGSNGKFGTLRHEKHLICPR